MRVQSEVIDSVAFPMTGGSAKTKMHSPKLQRLNCKVLEFTKRKGFPHAKYCSIIISIYLSIYLFMCWSICLSLGSRKLWQWDAGQAAAVCHWNLKSAYEWFCRVARYGSKLQTDMQHIDMFCTNWEFAQSWNCITQSWVPGSTRLHNRVMRSWDWTTESCNLKILQQP